MSHPSISTQSPPPSPDSPLEVLRASRDIHSLNFAWLIRLRWVAITGQTAVVIASWAFLELALPYFILAAILVVEVISNLALIAWGRTGKPRKEPMVALVLLADIVFLTTLLAITGGAANPFGLLYLIHVALAALVLRPLWTWGVTLVSAIAFVGLHFVSETAHYLPWATQPDIWSLETQGRWMAFVVSAGVIAFFINMIQKTLNDRDHELRQIREAQLRSEKLASLATLAAGAAHEFSTPLSTIALVAKELERGLEREEIAEHYVKDAALIRDQVDRCRDILRQMSADAGELPGEFARPVAVSELIEHILDGSLDRDRVDVVLITDRQASLTVPPTALGQALRGLVNNALLADPQQPVELRAHDDGDDLLLQICDRGVGMPPSVLERVGEPFFTTRETGAGMGLGVFLARTLVEKIGGDLHFESQVGEGTCVTVRLPGTTAAASALDSDSSPSLSLSPPAEVIDE